ASPGSPRGSRRCGPFRRSALLAFIALLGRLDGVEGAYQLDLQGDALREDVDGDAFVAAVDALGFFVAERSRDEAVGDESELAEPVGIGEAADQAGHDQARRRLAGGDGLDGAIERRVAGRGPRGKA